MVGPFVKPAPRILTYASFASTEGTVVVRLSATADELVGDLRERRPLLAGHGIALGLVALLGGLAMFPHHGGGPTVPGPALGAYEQAMERLRDQGEVRTRAHEVEKQRMEDLARDREPMARAGELTAGMVHEVRNGLGTIVGYARLLEKGSKATADQEAARGILDECQTLETVVRRFMDFVRDESLNLVPFDLARLLSRVAARESRGRPGAEVRLALPSGLQALVGDEELLERAFENLIRNGREAAGLEGHVLVTAEVDEHGRLAVRIVDDGPGLPRAKDWAGYSPSTRPSREDWGSVCPWPRRSSGCTKATSSCATTPLVAWKWLCACPFAGPRLDRNVTFRSGQGPRLEAEAAPSEMGPSL